MASTPLKRHRAAAFLKQQGRCFYCEAPMWLSAPDQFVRCYQVSPRQAKALQCTAEHLLAQQCGGQDIEQNIVAACLCCNSRRHKRKTAPEPDDFRNLVVRRIQRGGWHPAPVLKLVQQ